VIFEYLFEKFQRNLKNTILLKTFQKNRVFEKSYDRLLNVYKSMGLQNVKFLLIVTINHKHLHYNFKYI